MLIPRQRHGLWLYLSVAFIACAMAPLAALTALQLRQVDAAVRAADVSQAQATENLARDVAAHVAMHRRALEAAAHQVTVSGDLSGARLTSILRGLRTALPGFVNLNFSDARGITIAFEPPTESMIGADFSDRWHYREVMERRRTVVSPVIKGRGGTEQLIVTIVVPYFAQTGQVLGYVLGALDLSQVGAIVSDTKLEGRSYAVVTDAFGGAINYPHFDLAATPEDLSGEAVVSVAAAQRSGVLTHESRLSGERVISTYRRLDDLGWLLWISRPLAERDSARREAVTSAGGLLLVALIGSGLLAWGFTARTDKAVGELLSRMRQLRRGGETLEPVTDGPREFSQLARGLDDMAHALAVHQRALVEANATLEQRVHSRTERLRRRQGQLAALYRQTAAQRSTLQAVFESISEALILVDDKGRVVYANRSLSQLLRIPNEPLLGMSFERELLSRMSETFGGNCVDVLRNLFAGALSQATISGRGRHLAVTMFDVRNAGDRLGRGGLIRDVTGAREVEQMKDHLISMAAHEFKTPVTALRMRVESLLRTDANWSEQFRTELLRGMLDDVAQLQILVTDWLDVARIESGGLRLTADTVQIARLLATAVECVRPQGDFKASIDAADSLRACMDAQRMQQVLINLLSNAIRYCNRPPEIVLRAWQDANGWLLIQVEDNGIGIPKEDQARIFDRFFQVARGNTRRPGGTGLGLAIARGIVVAHGGSIEVASVPGEGSVFTLRLPQSKVDLAEDAA
jgi:PAS domain S-box-containing protein